jgi:hypothetical protein
MLRQLTKYGAGLIALYLVVYNASGAGRLVAEGSRGASGLVRTFQGR